MAHDPPGLRSATARTVALLFLALAFAGFTALGIWQVDRLRWKHALIAQVDSRIHAAAVPAPGPVQWAGITAESDGYRRVFVGGRYLQHQDTRVQALTALGAGWWVLSPLRTDSGDIVLVNRGFVPTDGAASPPPAGDVRIEGLLRPG
ncbi:MAG: SURF1 family protein, partial [Comamonadaceae bacterium]